MPKQTKFRNNWLDQEDGNGHKLRLWCRADEKDLYAGYCKLCFKKLPCSNMGLLQILQHSTGDKHKQIACVRFGKAEKHLTSAAAEVHGEVNNVTGKNHFI
jgi:hypothetical protein